MSNLTGLSTRKSPPACKRRSGHWRFGNSSGKSLENARTTQGTASHGKNRLAARFGSRRERWAAFDRQPGARCGRRTWNAQRVLVAGAAGLVAGAMSMAAGEYVSVHSQADAEQGRPRTRASRSSHQRQFGPNTRSLPAIYVGRGLEPALAKAVAEQLMAHDALGAHARDELGISETLMARPIQAAFASAAAFAAGAAISLVVATLAPGDDMIAFVAGASLLSLVGMGALAAHAGGANVIVGAARVTVLGRTGHGPDGRHWSPGRDNRVIPRRLHRDDAGDEFGAHRQRRSSATRGGLMAMIGQCGRGRHHQPIQRCRRARQILGIYSRVYARPLAVRFGAMK